MEGDSLCAHWVNGRSRTPWGLADVAEEVHVLARRLEASFSHAKHSANSVADILAKEGVSRNSLMIVGVFLSHLDLCACLGVRIFFSYHCISIFLLSCMASFF